jgi:hypothetical protein
MAETIIAATQRYPPEARDVELEYELPQTGAGITTQDSAAITAITGYVRNFGESLAIKYTKSKFVYQRGSPSNNANTPSHPVSRTSMPLGPEPNNPNHVLSKVSMVLESE